MVVSTYCIPTHHQLSGVLHTTKPNFYTKNMTVHACQKTQWPQTFLNSYNRAKKTEFKCGQISSFKDRYGNFGPRNREDTSI